MLDHAMSSSPALPRVPPSANAALLADLLTVSELVVALDDSGRIVLVNEHTAAALGCTTEELIGRDWIDSALEPKFRDAARGWLDEALRATPGKDGIRRFSQFEHAINEGEHRRVYRWRTTTTADAAGRVTGLIAHGTDVTDLRRSHRRLLRNQDELTQLAAVAQAVAREPDARRAVVDAVQRLTDSAAVGLYVPGEAPGTLVISHSAPPVVEGRRVGGQHGSSGALQAFETGEPVFVDEARGHDTVNQALQRESGIRSLLFQPIILRDSVVGVLAVGWREPREQLTDRQAGLVAIAAGEAAAAIDRVDSTHRWEQAAYTDELTGIWNRRAFERAYEQALAVSAEGEQPLAVALMDLNGFKRLNDTEGHAAGDAVLRECACLWQQAIRPTDTVARLGGDEFAVLLPGCTPDAIEGMALKLRTALRHEPGCGVGIAVWDGEESASGLLQRADDALYADKARQAAGRLNDPRRLAAVKATGLLDAPADPRLTEITEFVTRLLDVPISTVTLVTEERQFFAAETGAPARELQLDTSYCRIPTATAASSPSRTRRPIRAPPTTRRPPRPVFAPTSGCRS